MKRILACDYLPTEIEKFILDCRMESKDQHCVSGQDALNLEIIWRMNFYRYWTEQYIVFKRIFEKQGGEMVKFSL